MIRLGESENVEMPEKNEFRLSLLKQADESLRNTLKNLSAAEEITFINDKLSILVQKKIDTNEVEIKEF